MAYVNTLDYVTIASTGDATDFGDLTAATVDFATANSIVRGLIFSGYEKAQAIDYITIASVGNAADFGDHLLGGANARFGWCVHNKLYAYYSRVSLGSQEKHTIATAANATAFTFSNLLFSASQGQYAFQHATIKGWIAASG